MEELQNLRSDSEILEGKILCPIIINIFKFGLKVGVATLSLLSFFHGRSCGDQMKDFISGSCISLLIESALLLIFLITSWKSVLCIKFASYFTIFFNIFSVITDIFYVGWGIYTTIIYFNENSCDQDLSFTDFIGLCIVIYYLFMLSVMTCCCGAKLCMCFSALMATAKTDVDRSLSQDLVMTRRESINKEEEKI